MRFDVLDRALPVRNSHFIEASAGTGKTFAIEHLVTRLIIEGEAPPRIQHILVVTFTRAATRELKGRIYRNLKRVQQQLQNESSPFDYVQALFEQKERALQRIEDALVHYDLAPIYTLHGFCYRMLQEYGTYPLPSSEEQLSFPLVERKIQDYLKYHLTLPAYSPVQIQLLWKRWRRERPRLVAELQKLVESSKQLPRFPTHAELAALVEKELTRDLESLAPLTERYVKMGEFPVQEQLALLAKRRCSPDDLDKLLEAPLFLEGMREERLKKRPPPLPTRYDPTLVERLQRTLLPLVQQGQDPAAILLRIASDLRAYLRPLLEEKGLLSPDQLLIKMQEALKDPAILHALQHRFQAAFIDEFQDTDPIQWDLCLQLFSNTTLYLVGDPKQSIYAFRSADLAVYLRAAEEMGVEKKRFLDTNYRSTPSLVKTLNELFSTTEWCPPLTAPPLRAGSDALPVSIGAPVEYWVAVEPKGRSKKFPSDKLLRSTLLPAIASHIEALHAEIPYDDVAILVKDRFMAEEVATYLAECGLPVHAASAQKLTDSDAYGFLRRVVAALQAPYHEGLLRAVLGSPLMAYTAADLAGYSLPFLRAKAEINRWGHLLATQGEAHWLQAVMTSPFVRPEGTLKQLAALILERKEKTLIAYLDALPFALNEPEQKVHEERGSVAIMTTHKSKGLEFPVVFALGAAARNSLHDLVSIRTQEGTQLTPLDVNNPCCVAGLEEENREKLRALYVALTRAQRQLILIHVTEEVPRPVAPVLRSPLELFIQKRGELPLERHVLVEAPQPHFEAIQRKVVRKSPIWTPPLLTPPPLSFTALASPLPHIEGEPCAPLLLPSGASTGVLLHFLLEQIIKRGWHRRGHTAAIHELIAFTVKGTEAEPFCVELQGWLPTLFTHSLGEFCLADLPGRSMLEEVEFLYPTKRGRMKGFADLLFSWQGKYYILDWKSNNLSSYTEEGLQRAMLEGDYFLQASLYAEALRRYVQLFDNRPFSELFGGAFYYFIRGKGVYHFMPEPYS
jgi:exodeoxyribonuclease V beta subunit